MIVTQNELSEQPLFINLPFQEFAHLAGRNVAVNRCVMLLCHICHLQYMT